MATTFIAIATVEVGAGGASSIEFTSIPTDGTYTDLVIFYSIRTTRSLVVDDLYLQLNSDNLENNLVLESNGSTVASNTGGGYNNRIGIVNADTATANTFGNGMTYIPNYASSNSKSISSDTISENNGTTAYAFLAANRDATSSAISSIKLYSGTSNTIKQYSTATLYGIKNS